MIKADQTHARLSHMQSNVHLYPDVMRHTAQHSVRCIGWDLGFITAHSKGALFPTSSAEMGKPRAK